MSNKLQAKLAIYNVAKQQIYKAMQLNSDDMRSEFTFSLAVGRSTRRLREAVKRMEDMTVAVSHVPTSAELAEAIRLAKEGLLSN